VTLILTFFELCHCNSRLYKCSATYKYTLSNFVSYPHSVRIHAHTGSNMFTIMLCNVGHEVGKELAHMVRNNCIRGCGGENGGMKPCERIRHS